MFSVRITDIGMREPHWHPETAEMGYVTSGRGHMTILSPGGHTETFEIKPGDTYFIRLHIPITSKISAAEHCTSLFSDQPIPGENAPHLLFARGPGSGIRCRRCALPKFPISRVDPLIVPRSNPLSP